MQCTLLRTWVLLCTYMKRPLRPARAWSQKAPASTPQFCSCNKMDQYVPCQLRIHACPHSLPSPLLAVRAPRVLASRFPMERERVRDGDGDEGGGKERGKDRSPATHYIHTWLGCHHSQSARRPNMTMGIKHPYFNKHRRGEVRPTDEPRTPRVPTSRCLLPTAWVTQSGPNPCEPVSRGRR